MIAITVGYGDRHSDGGTVSSEMFVSVDCIGARQFPGTRSACKYEPAFELDFFSKKEFKGLTSVKRSNESATFHIQLVSVISSVFKVLLLLGGGGGILSATFSEIFQLFQSSHFMMRGARGFSEQLSQRSSKVLFMECGGGVFSEQLFKKSSKVLLLWLGAGGGGGSLSNFLRDLPKFSFYD